MTQPEIFFRKHPMDKDDVMYLYRQDRKTILCDCYGNEAECYIPLYEFEEFFSDSGFVCISKGVLVRRDKIAFIDDEGIYTMADGKVFQGRKRFLSSHKKLRKELNLDTSKTSAASAIGNHFINKFKILDEMPVAYCVIELVFDDNGHSIDFIFRYCNKYMEIVEGIPVEEMVNRSFYEVFQNGDRKWLVSYADVALNGTKHTLHDYSPEIDKNLTVFCYQPEPGFCACVLIPDGEIG